jgi:hypothetical protein
MGRPSGPALDEFRRVAPASEALYALADDGTFMGGLAPLERDRRVAPRGDAELVLERGMFACRRDAEVEERLGRLARRYVDGEGGAGGSSSGEAALDADHPCARARERV